MPAPTFLAGLPKPILFGLYGAIGGLLGAVILGEPAWQAPQAAPGRAAVATRRRRVQIGQALPRLRNTFKVQIARERFDGPVTITFGDHGGGSGVPRGHDPRGRPRRTPR